MSYSGCRSVDVRDFDLCFLGSDNRRCLSGAGQWSWVSLLGPEVGESLDESFLQVFFLG